MNAHRKRHVAVVGSGVAGLTAAYVVAKSAHVTLFEADERLGGHADTHDVTGPDGRLAIDTGFIVHNERTYPTLLRMFAELGVATQDSEMSMSISDRGTGLEWAGALGLKGVFPTWRTSRTPAYLRMLPEIPRFHREARKVISTSSITEDRDVTLREFLEAGGFSDYFAHHFMEPLVAAVWSCDPALALDYPARYLFSFLDHHGMLSIFGSPTWRTVTGGSREYVRRVAAGLPDVRLGTKVTTVTELADGVELTDGNGQVTSYDAVVIATHPAQALSMLSTPSDLQREVLSAITYSPNVAQLHTDTSLLPRAKRAWASWNFQRPAANDGLIVTYDLTRLQRLPTETHYLVTLGGTDLVDPASVIETMHYEHPLYTPASVAAQQRLGEIATDRVTFAGAWHGWGFHEDGARSGLTAAERLGFEWVSDLDKLDHRNTLDHGSSLDHRNTLDHGSSLDHRNTLDQGSSLDHRNTLDHGNSHQAPRVYDTTIRHTRRTPWKRAFTHRSRTWLVDLDHLPDHGILGRFEARDHLGDPAASLRGNLETFLAAHDIAIPGGQILMAANARALGHSFNPISVFWCHDASGALAATVVEVHNTYGDRHAYLVHPDEQGRASTPKSMYVSPFHGTDGTYELAVPVPGNRTADRLQIAVTLHTDDGAVFSASLSGVPTRSGPLRAAPAALKGSVLIRLHGVWLWARRLPIRPRPRHAPQEGV
ncbi:FAD-dependent oxidoreductase [Nocardioides sp.]|uniref:FAD-dependent oxidoreductase n=1 Tax=Nocardioides sp. TaxID=35761 RepID=UPI003D0B1A28